MRLIDADAIADNIAVLLERNPKLIAEWLANIIEDEITEAPTIEAEPVRRGHWDYAGVNTYDGVTAYEPTYRCSACGSIFENYVRLDVPVIPTDASFPRYCPNCGAKMDGE